MTLEAAVENCDKTSETVNHIERDRWAKGKFEENVPKEGGVMKKKAGL